MERAISASLPKAFISHSCSIQTGHKGVVIATRRQHSAPTQRVVGAQPQPFHASQPLAQQGANARTQAQKPPNAQHGAIQSAYADAIQRTDAATRALEGSSSDAYLVEPYQITQAVRDFHAAFLREDQRAVLQWTDRTIRLASLLRPTELSMIANHFAKINYRDRRWWEAFAEVVVPVGGRHRRAPQGAAGHRAARSHEQSRALVLQRRPASRAPGLRVPRVTRSAFRCRLCVTGRTKTSPCC